MLGKKTEMQLKKSKTASSNPRGSLEIPSGIKRRKKVLNTIFLVLFLFISFFIIIFAPSLNANHN